MEQRIVVDISISLDGYVTAPGADLRHGVGPAGEVLHHWARDGATDRDHAVIDAATARTGSVVMGRRTFEFVDGPHGWDHNVGYGAEREPDQAPPVFVVTGSVPGTVRLRDRFTFVTEGLAAALERARDAAGERDVVIMGGGATARSALLDGLADTLTVHLVPAILGGGTPLFPASGERPLSPLTLTRTDSVSTPHAEHLTYRVHRTGGGPSTRQG
ncbi:DNA-binding protein [Saccharomonospora piscinae]|uniref:DNA-binding protein n=1 Tax=Saccharomonospora piscinae TaxID=687388 RepID=A0A1V9A4T3_SACPI|nr:dihydrofolate reductase family protein [Saccharomonospora piscinae]OQO92093.1 DNA-binding protein [Saccharomonospora piscinae]